MLSKQASFSGETSLKSPMEDFRKHRRREARLECKFRHGAAWQAGSILDFSVAGAFVESKNVPLPGFPVQIAVGPLAGRPEVVCHGRVIHQGRYLTSYRNFLGFGVQFGPLAPLVKSLFEALGKRFAEAPGNKFVME